MFGSKKFSHGELLHEAPVVAIRGSEESGAAIGGFVAESEFGARRKGEILSLKNLGGKRGRGDNDATDSAEAEAEEGPKFGGEGSEGLVERRGEEVEVAEERKGGGTGREAAEMGGGGGGFGGF